MHELSLAENICDIALAHTPKGQRIMTIVVECGPLSGVVPESLNFCFSFVAPQKGLKDTTLDLHQLSASADCPACSATQEVETMWAACTQCGHTPLTVKGGREFRVKEVEVAKVEK